MSEELQQKLRTQLWTVANTLRGNMSASDFMYFTLGFIFYKYLSEKIEMCIDAELEEDGSNFKEAWASNEEELKEELKKFCMNELGYFIEPEYLYSSVIEAINRKENILPQLERSLKKIEDSTIGHDSEEDFGGYWWLLLPILQNMTLIAVNQLFINSCLVTQNQRGTKTGQNHGKIKSRTLRPKYPLWNTSVSFAKVQICPLKNEGKSLFLSFTTHFPTIVPQMWLLQTVLTSNGLVCENWVLNFVLHSVGHFQKRELAIEPKICHPYCPILGFVNV